MKKIILLTAFFSLLQLPIPGSFYAYGKDVEAIAGNTRDGTKSPVAGMDTEADQIFQTEEKRRKENHHCCGAGKGSVQTAERFYSQLFPDGGTDPYTGKYYPPGNKDGNIDPYTGRYYPRGNEDGNTDPYTGKFYPRGDEHGRIDPYTGRYYPSGNEDGRTVPEEGRTRGRRR